MIAPPDAGSAGARAIEAFAATCGSPPALLARAPGRVNLIGEHTDYNGGFVLPMAIDRAAWIACRRREDRRVRIRALDFDEAVTIDIDALEPGAATGGWSEYARGVLWALREGGCDLRGWDGVLASDVPIGAGLSSSAAIELALVRACQAVSGFPWDPKPLALRAQHAENAWVGVRCGNMDQLIAACAEAGAALLIDCLTLDTQAVPLPAGVRVVVLDTATRRGLADSAYNERRAQCERAAAVLGVRWLREADAALLAAHAATLDGATYRRARHVISENARTLEAVEAARAGHLTRLGQLFDASHASLRDDFEVSSAALDTMVASAREAGGCLGARMTGAGFGGCAVALVEEPALGAFTARLARAYTQATGLVAAIYPCRPAAGASLIGL